MAGNRVNPFLEQQKRLKQQEELVEMAKPEGKVSSRSRKVPMNITIPQDSKDRLQRYATKKNLSASVLIQLWIDEHCVE